MAPFLLHMKIAGDLRGWHTTLAEARSEMGEFLIDRLEVTSTIITRDFKAIVTDAHRPYASQTTPFDFATADLLKFLDQIKDLINSTNTHQITALTLARQHTAQAQSAYNDCLKELLLQTADLLDQDTLLQILPHLPRQLWQIDKANSTAFIKALKQQFLQAQTSQSTLQAQLKASKAREEALASRLHSIKEKLSKIASRM